MDSRAYLLHSRPWRETSVLLDVFCHERGRLRVAARGIKGKRRSPLTGVLQAFTPLHLQLNLSRDYYYLTDAEPLAPAWPLAVDSSLCALYCNELLMRLLPERDSHPTLYDHYERTLQQLSQAGGRDPATAICLREFEWLLLTELGYGIALDCDETGAALQRGARYRLDVERGIYRGTRGASETKGSSEAGAPGGTNDPNESRDPDSFAADDLLAFAAHNWAQQPQEAKRLLRQLLAAHLGPEPLHTRELWRSRQVLKQLVDDPHSD